RQTVRPAQVLVIDSGSDPANAQRLQEICAAHRFCRCIRVEREGLSLARNTALRAAADAEWLAFLDDDALAERDWYESLQSALQRADATTAIIGGRVTPIWPDAAAAPRSARWRRLLSCVEDEQPGLVEHGANVCGANLAVRRAELESIRGFPLQLGRVGDVLLGGEEWYVIYRFIQSGLRVRFDPSFRVRHKVPAVRLTREWVEERAFWEGVTHSRLCDLGVLHRAYALRAVPMLPRLAGLWLLKNVLAGNDDWMIRY